MLVRHRVRIQPPAAESAGSGPPPTTPSEVAPDPRPSPGWPGPTPTRLALAVVQVEDAHALVERLGRDGFGATCIDAAGGFLRRENAVVLVALHEDRLPDFLEGVRATCRQRMVVWFPPLADEAAGAWPQPIDVEVGGAVVFVLPIERVEYLSRPPRSQPEASGRPEVDREAAALGA
jgi:uncharacterized protein YaaQ